MLRSTRALVCGTCMCVNEVSLSLFPSFAWVLFVRSSGRVLSCAFASSACSALLLLRFCPAKSACASLAPDLLLGPQCGCLVPWLCDEAVHSLREECDTFLWERGLVAIVCMGLKGGTSSFSSEAIGIQWQ